MNFNQINKVHFIGIGGIGISYVAHFFLEKGKTVSGSDLNQTIITDQLAAKGAVLFKGHTSAQVPKDADLVVYNDAIPTDNVELLEAKQLGIPVMTNFAVVGELSKNFTTIVIAGNKGKTTTTAMLSEILTYAGCDPTAMVGSLVNDWKCNYREGGSEFLVVEGDEYKEHFLQIDADIAVITNMAADHLDYYGTEEKLIEAFQKFIDKLPKDGLLVMNADDEMAKSLTMPACQVLKFSLQNTGDINAHNLHIANGIQEFEVTYNHHNLGKWSLGFPGRFNVENALAASVTALYLEIKPEIIEEALSKFHGTWRRYQRLGKFKAAELISDYAHHPNAVHATIEASKDFFPNQRVVAVFQPHTRHRTQSLFTDFVHAFDGADLVIIPEIYEVAGREVISNEEMNSSMLVESILARGRVKNAHASGDLKSTLAFLEKEIKASDVILMMGAGDIYQLADQMGQDALNLFKAEFADIIKENEPLSKYSTFKIGGPAEILVEPKTSDDLIRVFEFVIGHNVPYFILGGGANVLLPDEGMKGIVIRPRNRDFTIDGKTVSAGAGLPLAKLAQDTAKAGLTGLEWCIAVPGTVGGAVRGNAGAFGGEVKDTLVSARIFDGSSVKELSNKDLHFRYRSSRIKDHKGSEVVIDAVFELMPGDAKAAQQRVKDMLKKKFADQPMGELCAGCLFKNIELVPGKEQLSSASKGNPTPKFFEDVKKEHPEFIEIGKVPAGWIIEMLGYKQKEPHKGIKVSEKHANFLVNTGGGTARAVRELARMIKNEAKELYGVELEEEVQFV